MFDGGGGVGGILDFGLGPMASSVSAASTSASGAAAAASPQQGGRDNSVSRQKFELAKRPFYCNSQICRIGGNINSLNALLVKVAYA
jgi:hypothetical protein